MLAGALVHGNNPPPPPQPPRGSETRSRPERYLDEGPHGEQVGQHGGQALGQAALGDEPCLQLRQTDGIIALLPVPAWNVQQMSLGHVNRDRKPRDEEDISKASCLIPRRGYKCV